MRPSPRHVKLSPPPGAKAEVLIINAVECEPYLTSDHALMMSKSDEILVGVEILKRALGVSRAVIGVENNKKDAILRLSQIAMDYPGTEVMPLKVQYPQGGEKQLIDAVLRKQVKSGALPISAGAVVQNVGTVFAVYEAVQKNKPLVERITTVTGKHLETPSNYRARIGTPIGHLITASGGLPEDTGKIIGGGPMMGKALLSTDIPVTKGTSGILILPREESTRRPMRNCIRCAKCVTVCPTGAEPPPSSCATSSMPTGMLPRRATSSTVLSAARAATPALPTAPLLDYIRTGKQKVIRHHPCTQKLTLPYGSPHYIPFPPTSTAVTASSATCTLCSSHSLQRASSRW